MGTARAPVVGSGAAPACTWRVSNPQLLLSVMWISSVIPDPTVGYLAALGPAPRHHEPSGRERRAQPPEASSTRCLPAEIHGIMERSSPPTFSIGCCWPASLR